MATIVLRADTGASPLTQTQMDDNLTNLNNELITAGSFPNADGRTLRLQTRDAGVADVDVDTSTMYDAIVADATAVAIALG